MKEIKQRLTELKQALPMMRDFGGLDGGALKAITDDINEILTLCNTDSEKD